MVVGRQIEGTGRPISIGCRQDDVVGSPEGQGNGRLIERRRCVDRPIDVPGERDRVSVAVLSDML